ncbi:hypothetical protein AB0469_28260 [Streptomyces sp. NPDC093801]|uniref:hypothetical protein n=1 Tax=Streptomyces sp. NPDC093801 TaxID=3155203 RepID=UPI00344E754C
MTNAPAVVVGRPEAFGLRKVTVDGKTIGKACSAGDLQRILRHAGLAFESEIQWMGGDSTVWPGCGWKRRATALLMAGGLLATVFQLVRIGSVDTFGALDYLGRITGFVFLAAAVVVAAAVLATFDYWRKRTKSYSGIVVFIGVLFSFAVNALLLCMHINAWVFTPYLPFRVVLLVWAGWALWVLFRERAWKGIRNPKRVVVGAIVPVFLAAANMAYTQVYLPSVTYSLVDTSAELGEATWDSSRKVMALTVHLRVKNNGQVPVYILGSIYWINGMALPNTPPRQDHGTYKLIDNGEFIKPPGMSLNPGEEHSEDEYVEIPQPERFKSVMASTELYLVRKDRAIISPTYENSGLGRGKLRKEGKDQDPPGPLVDYTRYQADLSNSNELLDEVRGRPRVTLWWVRQNRFPFMAVSVTQHGENKPFSVNFLYANDKAIERYGLQRIRGSMTQKPYTELVQEATGKHPAMSDVPAAPTDSGRLG